MRPLTLEEKSFIASVANKLEDSERHQLLNDIKHTTAVPMTPDGSRVEFQIDGYQRPPYRGQHLYGVEGKMLDADDVELSVLLYADENGRLFELELIRWDPNGVLAPRWVTLISSSD